MSRDPSDNTSAQSGTLRDTAARRCHGARTRTRLPGASGSAPKLPRATPAVLRTARGSDYSQTVRPPSRARAGSSGGGPSSFPASPRRPPPRERKRPATRPTRPSSRTSSPLAAPPRHHRHTSPQFGATDRHVNSAPPTLKRAGPLGVGRERSGGNERAALNDPARPMGRRAGLDPAQLLDLLGSGRMLSPRWHVVPSSQASNRSTNALLPKFSRTVAR